MGFLGDTVYFSNDADARLYRCDAGGAPSPVSHPGPWRYADGAADSSRDRIVCVVEEETEGEPLNYLATLPARGI